MAAINPVSNENIFAVSAWLGLNENPDGDTKLKDGEASVMRNFKITRDGNLQKRDGTQMVFGLMSAYTVQEEQSECPVKVYHLTSGKLMSYPSVSVGSNGLLVLEGQPVAVTYENIEQYAGYYWRDSSLRVYKLCSCVHEPADDSYTWLMKRVTTAPATVNQPVAGVWSGSVGGKEYMVAACDGKLWQLYDGEIFQRTELGDLDTENPVFFFDFSDKLYIMNGTSYKEWDGVTFQEVSGYVPLVAVSVPPVGGGTLLEGVNKLTGKRRAWVSPDGTATIFQLPEKDLESIDGVKDLAADTYFEESKYTVDCEKGTVTFLSAPAKGVNTVEIEWTAYKNFRNQVTSMRFSELYNGSNDTRVFLYGDGSNKAFYSGLDYDGKPRADYFPDMNELVIGEANTPITSLIRHYSKLIVYKSNSVYSVQYGVTTLVDNSTVATFYATPINRSIGNVAMGQVQLLLNSPFSLHGKDLYEWRNIAGYFSGLTSDERQARRVSDRIHATLRGFDLSKCYCFDDNYAQEYYICYNKKALVYNYARDAWYLYDNFDVSCMVRFRDELYIGQSDGSLSLFSRKFRADNGEEIRCYWESGSISFQKDFVRKSSSMLWVGIKPEEKGEVAVTVQTDRKSIYAKKIIASSLITFSHADFRRFSFNTNRKPHMNRLKIKAKKFSYYKLVFETHETNTTATILSTNIKVGFTGYAK